MLDAHRPHICIIYVTTVLSCIVEARAALKQTISQGLRTASLTLTALEIPISQNMTAVNVWSSHSPWPDLWNAISQHLTTANLPSALSQNRRSHTLWMPPIWHPYNPRTWMRAYCKWHATYEHKVVLMIVNEWTTNLTHHNQHMSIHSCKRDSTAIQKVLQTRTSTNAV